MSTLVKITTISSEKSAVELMYQSMIEIMFDYDALGTNIVNGVLNI